jgi:hypothetical protein
MKSINRFCLFLLGIIVFFSCRKDPILPDYRDNFVGDYKFTKYEGSHHGGYTWEDDGFGNPTEVWYSNSTEEILWQSTGSIEKKGRNNLLIIRYGNGEKFEVAVTSLGNISCSSDGCSDMEDPPFSSQSAWHFSGTTSFWGDTAIVWDEVNYKMDLGNNIPSYGLSYGGYSYKDWNIEGEKLY